MDLFDVTRVALGFVVLVGGGELLVRGASAVAAKWGLSPLVIGLTVVAVGTSAPEFAVTVGAVARGETDLAVGDVVGSNIANTLLILLFLALYAAYTTFLVLDATGHQALTGFTSALVFFALPLVLATLVASLAYDLKRCSTLRQG